MKTTGSLTILLSVLFCISSADHAKGGIVGFGSGANSFNIEFVSIGNPGNAADTTGNPNPAGSVANEFLMGKYEISEDMLDKANTLGGLFLTHTSSRGPNKPVTGITWNEAARFVNWLNTSLGYPMAYKFSLNPGDAGYTSNTQATANIVTWAVSDPGYNPSNLYRNSLAKFWLPSADEWYKAAYYDATTGTYFDYPTGSNTAPANVNNGTAAGTAVYGRPSQQGPADITDAGGLSPYGTMAQGGNVFEWNESDTTQPNGPVADNRVMRGGYWESIPGHLSASSAFSLVPTTQEDIRGFRVATSVPEPGAAMLIVMAISGLLWPRTTR